MMKLFWQMDNPGGQRYYRSTAPVKFLRKHVKNVEIDMAESISSLDYDAYLYHRLAQPPVYLKKRNKMILWELDDDIWNIPDWSPAFDTYRNPETQQHLSWFLENADYIIVSTHHLAQQVSGRTKRPIVVLPNLVDLEMWGSAGSWVGGETRILWAGSPYHEKDIDGIVQPLNQILKEMDNVKVTFFGDIPLSMADFMRVRWNNYAHMVPHARYHNKVEYIPFQPIDMYFNTLMSLKADICLAPLFPCAFANSKSNIKYIECSLTGSVTVASNLPPYQNTQAILVDKQIDWYGTLRNLIENPQRRMEESESARRDAINNWTWQSHASERWYSFFGGISA